MLENECNSAFRECIKSIALKNKIQTNTERMHTISRRLGSRQILWLLYDFLRPHVTGDSTFKIINLVKVSLDRFRCGVEQERLEAFCDKCDQVLVGISVDRPEDQVLRHALCSMSRCVSCGVLSLTCNSGIATLPCGTTHISDVDGTRRRSRDSIRRLKVLSRPQRGKLLPKGVPSTS